MGAVGLVIAIQAVQCSAMKKWGVLRRSQLARSAVSTGLIRLELSVGRI